MFIIKNKLRLEFCFSTPPSIRNLLDHPVILLEMPLRKGQDFVLRIETNEDAFLIYVDDKLFTVYRHRMPPNFVSMLSIWGRLQPFKLVIKSPEIILDPLNLHWRQIGGHLRRAESCRVGVVWGIGYDRTAWVWTGGWGGGFLGSFDSNNVHSMTDSQDYRVYENQRWNPVSGYTSTGILFFLCFIFLTDYTALQGYQLIDTCGAMRQGGRKELGIRVNFFLPNGSGFLIGWWIFTCPGVLTGTAGNMRWISPARITPIKISRIWCEEGDGIGGVQWL